MGGEFVRVCVMELLGAHGVEDVLGWDPTLILKTVTPPSPLGTLGPCPTYISPGWHVQCRLVGPLLQGALGKC